MRKLLFPPIVPNSLPAFDKTKLLRYYFKPSVANSMNQIKHLQMTIVRLDTNRSVLDANRYPFDIIFKTKSEIGEDSTKGFWYVDIPASLFPSSDIPYKIQIRLGETDITGMSSTQLGAVLKDLDKMSEWSIVTMAMPITVPDFGVQSFSEDIENRVASTGYVFAGFYDAKDPNKQETLSSYRYNLYIGDASDKSTWKLLSTSGEKYIGTTDKTNLSYTFPFELKEEGRFIVTMTVKTKNLYTSTKVYKIYSTAYPVLEMFNSIDVVPNFEDAQMDITVRAKQILMKPTRGTQIEYIKDEPGKDSYPNLTATHAKINGSVVSNNDIMLFTKSGKWVCQFKAFFPTVKNSLKEIVDNPIVEISQRTTLENESEYFTKIKVGCMKMNLAYPTSGNLNPNPEWEYRFIVRKEILIKQDGKEQVILSQNKTVVSNEIIKPKQEYYFYIKEDNGSMDVDIKKTYLSTNSKI